jgi:hypothetical protein
VIRALFDGGPFDGCEMALAGRIPGYLLLMEPPAGVAMYPLVVGADFDDDWPDQQRYELNDERLDAVDGGYVPTIIYRHAP